MKVLVATNQTQGRRASDFCFTTAGEPVCFAFQCDRDRVSANSDGGCGCGRSLVGLDSHKATTTCMVTEHPGMTLDNYKTLLKASHQDMGWYIVGDKKSGMAEALDEDAEQLLDIARRFPVGAVLELRKRVVEGEIELYFNMR